MGIIKFLLTFAFFYYFIKIVRSFFVVKKAFKTHNRQNMGNSRPGANPANEHDDAIEAEYKVIEK